MLAGTALASTLLIATVAAPLPAMAVVGDCAAAGPQAVRISDVVPIICINTETRNEPGRPYAIYLDTTAPFASIFVNNFGMLTAAAPGDTTALLTSTLYADSPITIINNAKATATSL